jgi:hypothetical protein
VREREGHARAVAPQRRFLQARGKGAARALSAHDPRAGGCLCGEAEGEVRLDCAATVPRPTSVDADQTPLEERTGWEHV